MEYIFTFLHKNYSFLTETSSKYLKKFNLFLILIFCFINTINIYSQDGTLDLTFDSDGKVTTQLGTFDETGYAVALFEDKTNDKVRKIYVAGQTFNGSNYDFIISRYNNNGSLDNTFGTNGIVSIGRGDYDDKARAIALQSDGKVIAAGMSSNGSIEGFVLVRFNTDGTLDNTFGTNGVVVTIIGNVADNIQSIAIQQDGKIVVAGFSYKGNNADIAVARYNTSGTLDNTFGTNGIVTTSIGSGADIGYKVLLQTDGKIVVIGSSFQIIDTDFAIIRYNPDGSMDLTFDKDGIVTTKIQGNHNETAFSGGIQTDGKIVVIGGSDNLFNDFNVARYNTDGSLDLTFSGIGITITDFGTGTDFATPVDLYIQKDKKILVGGYKNNGIKLDYALVRYLENGSIDKTFGNEGFVETDFLETDDEIRAIALQTDGKILAVGGSHDGTQKRISIARYNNPSLAAISSVQSENNDDIKLSPNPANDYMFVSHSALDAESIEIFNIFGESLPPRLDLIPALSEGEGVRKIDISNLAPGVYFIKIGDRFEKFVKM